MSPLERILEDKRRLRQQLASLPYERKLEIVKKLRARAKQFASSPPRRPLRSSSPRPAAAAPRVEKPPTEP